MSLMDEGLPFPVNKRVELKNWRFTPQHHLTGEVWFHPFFDNGSFFTLSGITVCTEYPEMFICKTAGDLIFFLYKIEEAIGTNAIKDVQHFILSRKKRMG